MGMRFEVSVNGRPVCVAGVRGDGVVTVIFDRVKRSPRDYPKNYHRKPHGCTIEEWSREHVSLSVAGCRWSEISEGHLGWHRQDLQPGDEVTVRVLRAGKTTRPKQKSEVIEPNDRSPPNWKLLEGHAVER